MLADRQPMSPNLFEQSLSPGFRSPTHGPYELRHNVEPDQVRSDLRRAPQVDRVIIWSQLIDIGNRGEHQPLTFDPFRSALPGWRLASEDVYTVRVIWDWREYWKWVRREYVRTGRPTAKRP
jgi:hypothetical protein